MEAPTPRPTMYILAGPNGAGKSTLYEYVIKPIIKAPFINADNIQKEEMHDTSMQAAYEAASIAEQRRQTFLANKQSFVSESTFSHPSKLKLIDDAIHAGFRIILYHVNVHHSDLSVARVAQRVKEGGHNVPEDKIRERYSRNQVLIKKAVLKADKAFIYDNSSLNKPMTMIMVFSHGVIEKLSGNIPTWASALYLQAPLT